MRLLNLFLPVLLTLAGCNIDGELAECPYNVKLEYWYTGNGRKNLLTTCVFNLREYLFDSDGILRRVVMRPVREGASAVYQLQPGDYTLVSWANIDSLSEVAPAEIGKTTLEEVQLYSETMSNTGRFFYGYRSFSVAPFGVTRGRIDLLHAYLRLHVTVRWDAGVPVSTSNLRMTLAEHYPVYRFLPEHTLVSPAGQEIHLPSRPEECQPSRRSIDVEMDISRQVNGEFIGFRLHNEDHPVFCLFAGDKALIREIDLYRFFHTMQIELSDNIRQEFDLQLVVDKKGNVNVSLAYVGDWIDGGVLGEGN